MTLPAPGYGVPGYGAPPPAPKRSKVPIIVLSVIIGLFAAGAVACFVGFGITISDVEPIQFGTPGTVGVHLTPGTYVICQPADVGLRPQTRQLDSTMVKVFGNGSGVVLFDLSGDAYCETFDSTGAVDTYEVIEFEIREAGNYTVTVSGEPSAVTGFATVGRRVDDSVFLWLGAGILSAGVAGVTFIALIVVLIVRATRKPKQPTWPAGPPGPGWGGGYGPPAWGQQTRGQPMPGQPMPGQTSAGPSPYPTPGPSGPTPDPGPDQSWPSPDPPGPPPPYQGPPSA